MSVQRTTATGGMETSFGFRQVGEGDKQPLVDEVFHRVARRYDLMNDLMSAGMHRLWKEGLVSWLNPPKRGAWKVLDVAGGTGDIAFRIVEASSRNAQRPCSTSTGPCAIDRTRPAGLDANRFVERPMPSNCLSPTMFRRLCIASVSATCRASKRRWPRVTGSEARRPLRCLEFRGRHAAARPRLRSVCSMPFRGSARSWPATASPTCLVNRSANSPTSRISRRW